MSKTQAEVRRDQEIEKLAESFKRNEWCAVLAPPLSGKSTLARQVRQEFSLRFPNWRVELIDLKPVGTLSELWDQIQQQAKFSQSTIETSNNASHVLFADKFARATAAASTPIGLIIDNVDSLPDQVLRLFAAELRRLANDVDFQSQRLRLRLILLGELKLYDLAGPNSPLHTIIRIIHMDDLNSAQSATLLCQRLDVPSLDPPAAAALFEQTQGHPHLVEWLSDRLRSENRAPAADAIQWAAQLWVTESQTSANPELSSFARIVDYLEHDPETFEIVMAMLDETPNSSSKFDGMGHLMCGAISEEQGRLIFRGKMIREALGRYFDPLRRADFATLHGHWQAAEQRYLSIAAEDIRERRKHGAALFRRRIMDLFWNISPYSMRRRPMSEAIGFVTASGHHFLGADEVLLWQRSQGTESAQIVGRFPFHRDTHDEIPDHDHQDLVEAAIRKNDSLKSLSNQGVICGIGDSGAVCRWALELRFERGVPNEEWFRDGLQNIEPMVFMILDRARQREVDDARLEAQRKLIHEIALKLLPAKDVDEVFQLIVDGVKDRLGYECVQLCLVFPDEQKLRGVKTNGVFERIQDLTVRDLNGDDPLAVVVRKKKSRIVKDCDDPDQNCDRPAAAKAEVKSFVAVPMIDEGEVVGVVQVGNTQRTGAFTQADADLLQLLADTAAVAIRLARGRDRTGKVLEASGTAMAFVNAKGNIEYCNELYREFFQVELNQPTPLQTEQEPPEPLVRLAFQRNQSITTVRQRDNRNYLVTAVPTEDHFKRYGGGIEVVGTRNPVFGLSESLREMFTLSERSKLEQAIVNCLVQRLGYSRVRLYKAVNPDRLESSCSMGMSATASEWFASGKALLQRDSLKKIGDGFECLRFDRPLIFVNQRLNQMSPALSVLEWHEDALHRPVVVVDLQQIPYTKELEKGDLNEWVDLPLGTPSQPLGKLSVDVRGSVRQLGIEDLEILALFGRWASDALNRVITLEKIQDQAKYVRDSRVAGDRRGLEAMVWDFLLNVTLSGGPGFNRAALFLRSPRSGLIQGFLCHGAADSYEWKDILEELPLSVDDRHQFLISAREKRMNAASTPDEQMRLQVLREMVVHETDPRSEFTAAVREKVPKFLRKPSGELRRFCDQLGWEPASEALVCPLIYDDECEGLVYVDRVFTKAPTNEADAESLQSMTYNLAMIVRPLQLAEQLRSQILGVSHSTISPVAAIRGLAEGLKPRLTDPEQRKILDLMIAEAQRSADLFRRLLRSAAGGTFGFVPRIKPANLAAILRRRVHPYQLLLEWENINVEVDAPESIDAEVDPTLMGDIFAELAANARSAILRASDSESVPAFQGGSLRGSLSPPSESHWLKIRVETKEMSRRCRIIFENTGPVIAAEGQAKIWDRFVSTSGGTGIGLWFAKEIVGLHHGTISYHISPAGMSAFVLEFPLQHEVQP